LVPVEQVLHHQVVRVVDLTQVMVEIAPGLHLLVIWYLLVVVVDLLVNPLMVLLLLVDQAVAVMENINLMDLVLLL
tara:strand:- start:1385 stop:1612 length:228 start_codon:yes stop_codon:yes gene_type:complete